MAAERVERAARCMVLPWPPTVNNYYTVSRGRKIMSAAGRKYQEAARIACWLSGVRRKPLSGSLRVVIVATPPDRRTRDLDNTLKPVLDALKGGKVIEDDGCIDDLRIVREACAPGNASVRVTVEEIGA